MKFLICLLLLVGGLSVASHAQAQGTPDPRWVRRAEQAGVTPLHENAYRQLALLHAQRDGENSAPAQALQQLGLDVLPVLAEALNDNTPTPTVKNQFAQQLSVKDSSAPQHLKVNEIVIALISRIAEHSFVLGVSPKEHVLSDVLKHPEWAPEFQKLIVSWYTHNCSKTLAERKIQDVSDPWFRNRIDAARWIGSHKLASGKGALEHYVETLLAHKTADTMTDTELAYAALALGQIKDKSALPLVQRVYDRFHGYEKDTNTLHTYYVNYIESDKMPLVKRALTLLGGKPQLQN